MPDLSGLVKCDQSVTEAATEVVFRSAELAAVPSFGPTLVTALDAGFFVGFKLTANAL